MIRRAVIIAEPLEERRHDQLYRSMKGALIQRQRSTVDALAVSWALSIDYSPFMTGLSEWMK